MKKILLFILVALALMHDAKAQHAASGGFRRAGTNAQTGAMQRQKLQDSLGLTLEQARKTDAIQQNFMLKMRAVKLDTRSNTGEKKAKLKLLQEQRRAKLKEVLTAEQIVRLDGLGKKVEKIPGRKKPRG